MLLVVFLIYLNNDEVPELVLDTDDENHDDMLSRFLADKVGEEEHPFHVIVIRIPVQGNDLVMVGEGETVEDEMRAFKMVCNDPGIFVRGGCDSADRRGSVGDQEIGNGPDGDKVGLSYGEPRAADPQVEQHLLDKRMFPALGRCVYGDILTVGYEIAQDGRILLVADKVLSGDVSVVYER